MNRELKRAEKVKMRKVEKIWNTYACRKKRESENFYFSEIVYLLTLGSMVNVSAMVSRCFTAQAAAISKPSAIL